MKNKRMGIWLLICAVCFLTGCSDKKEDKKAPEAEAEATPAPGDSLEELELEQYVKLGQYKGIQLEREETLVSDQQVEAEIHRRLAAAPMEVQGGVVEEGDLVNISYVGKIDGEAFEGGSGENQEITVGSKKMIAGFEAGLVGMKAGETKDLDLTFPDNYTEELSGKDVVFTVTVNTVSRASETLTEEWVTANSEAQTVEEYTRLVKDQLEAAERETSEDNRRMNAWQTVVEGCEILEYPEFLLEEGSNLFREEINGYAQMSGMELKDFLTSQEVTEEEFERQCQEFGKSIASQKLVMQAVKEAEGMKDSDEEAEELLEKYAQQAGMSSEELLEKYGREEIYQTITLERVCRVILENAVPQEGAAE